MGNQARGTIYIRSRGSRWFWNVLWSEDAINLTASSFDEQDYPEWEDAEAAAVRWATKHGLKVKE